MGSNRISTPVGAPAVLRRQVLDIEGEVVAQPAISPAVRKKLFGRLDALSSSLDSLRSSKSGASEFVCAQIESDLDDLPPKIISLYGEIETRVEDTKVKAEIQQVVAEADHLETQLDKGNIKAVAQEVTKLKRHIQAFCENHPSRLPQNLDKLNRVSDIAQRADRLLDKGDKNNFASSRANQLIRAYTLGSNSTPQLMNQLNLLEIQKFHYGHEQVDKEGAVELLEIAEAFYYNRVRADVLERFHLLPPSIQRVCKKRFAEVGITTPAENFVKTAQALVAASDDLAFGKGLLSVRTPQELDHFFKEAMASETT